MPVQLDIPLAVDLLAIPGVRIGVAQAGIRKANRKDLTVFLLDEGSAVGAVFTQNRYAAAPVQVCRDHLSRSDIRALVIRFWSIEPKLLDQFRLMSRVGGRPVFTESFQVFSRLNDLHCEWQFLFDAGSAAIGARCPET